MNTTPRRPRRWIQGAVVATTVLLASVACSPPGATRQPAGTPSAPTSVATALPPEEVTLNVTIQTATFQGELFDEFSRQHPNVTFKVTQEEYNNLANSLPRILNATTTPDLVRAPSLGNLVKNNLVTNLDPYAQAYGWEGYPASVRQQMSMEPGGTRGGTGALYQNAVGGYGLLGLFYNKRVGERLGMTSPPATLAELDAVLAKAKEAGVTPIVQPAGNFLSPFQNLVWQYEQPQRVNDWTFGKPDATFDTPAIRDATGHFARWAKAGYFPDDAATLTLDDIFSRMKDDEALFVFDGDFNATLYQQQLPGDVGFLTMPKRSPDSAGCSGVAPLAFVIPAKAQHADVAGYFLNWVNTDAAAREISLAKGGSYPGGPVEQPLPEVPDGSVTAQTLPAAVEVLKADAACNYLSNASSGIFTTTFVPQLELLAAGKTTPEAFVQKVQADYTQQLGR